MKMVKSLLLGTAAGLVAMSGAQAADLPVKAKPVQYVKICSLYGAGFYYIPGTDMCLKIGGWARAEYAYGMRGSFGAPSIVSVNNRTTNDSVMRARGYITADARNQTEYGTVRSYIAVGLSGNNVDMTTPGTLAGIPGVVFDANRAFIQFAGFTFGIAQSFYDFYSFAATGYIPDFYSDTGDSGWMTFGYTAQFGGGFSATVAAEMRRSNQIIGTDSSGILNNVATGGNVAAPSLVGGTSFAQLPGYGGFRVPDVVGNLRLDQAWGSAQVMGALHQVNMAYDGTGSSSAGNTALENSNYQADKWGFVVGAGAKILFPSIGTGDYFQTQVNYTQGALKYLWVAGNSNPYLQRGNVAAYGVNSDAVFGSTGPLGANTGLNLTTAWGLNAAYEHFWNNHWRTSVHGGFIAVSYNDQANALLCSMEGNGTGSLSSGTLAAGPGCGNNWTAWSVGTRTQWNIDASTYLGLDIAYTQLNTATANRGGTNLLPLAGSSSATVSPATTVCTVPSQNCIAGNEGIWSARFRVHRDFYP
jgi:Porin subfamily